VQATPRFGHFCAFRHRRSQASEGAERDFCLVQEVFVGMNAEMAEGIVDRENRKAGGFDFQPEEGIFVAVVFAARLVKTDAIEDRSAEESVEDGKFRGRISTPIGKCAMLLGLPFIAPAQFTAGGGFGEIGDAADEHIGGIALLPVRENEIVGADFCIGIHEQYIRKAGLLDQIIPCGGSTYIFCKAQMRAVGQEFDHFVALDDAFIGRSIVGNENFVVEFRISILCLQFFALFLHIGHQTQTIDVVSGNKY
jgi:hypothetical protein